MPLQCGLQRLLGRGLRKTRHERGSHNPRAPARHPRKLFTPAAPAACLHRRSLLVDSDLVAHPAVFLGAALHVVGFLSLSVEHGSGCVFERVWCLCV